MTFGRELSNCTHDFNREKDNCYLCGVRNYQSHAIKTQGYSNPIHMNMRLYFKQMKRRSAKTIVAKQITESTSNLLSSICEKFSYGNETLALGLYMYQCLKDLSPYEKFWAACCLIVASKGMELDKNVPYLNRYQRYADKDHTQEEYETAERVIFQAMNFDLQHSTFVTFINYYLTSGVIFFKDDLNKSLVQYFEDDVLLKAKEYLRKGNFSQYDQQKLALWIIKDTRKKYNLSEWPEELQLLSNYLSQEVAIELEEENSALQPRKYDINNSSNHSTLPKTQKVVDLKNICIRKKLDQVSISKTLVKTSTTTRPSSSAKQNSISSTYQPNQASISFGTHSIMNPHKLAKNSNIILAPINTQYLSNNSIFNLATKRR